MGEANTVNTELCRGLLNWYDFRPGSDILFIGMETNPFADAIVQLGGKVSFASVEMTCDEDWVHSHFGNYRYIVSVEDLEHAQHPVNMLRQWRKLLPNDGVLLLGLNNRFGLRYFCGDGDPYTGHNFDGIENYQHVYVGVDYDFRGRMYSKAEIRMMLHEAGWKDMKFFSVLPDLRNPYFLCAEDYIPREDLEGRIFPMYNSPETVFLEDETLYGSLMENGMFHSMANAYFVECPLSGNTSPVKQVTVSVDRAPENAMLTILNDDIVEKRAVFPEGRKRLEVMNRNIKELAQRGLKVVPGRLENDRYFMPYIPAKTGQAYLKELYMEDMDRFLRALEQFRDAVMNSSEILEEDKGDGRGAILKKGYIDLTPLNSFYVDGEFVFFDQEFCEENYPVNAILIRVVFCFYSMHPEKYKSFSEDDMIAYLGLDKFLDEWRAYDGKFIGALLRQEQWKDFYSRRRRDPEVVNRNRKHIGTPDKEKKDLCLHELWHGMDWNLTAASEKYHEIAAKTFFRDNPKELVLFGSGRYAGRFLEMYRKDYPVAFIVDNQENKWGEYIDGIEIVSPEFLQGANKDKYKILVCIRRFDSVVEQLEGYGITDYYVFNPGFTYPLYRRLAERDIETKQTDCQAGSPKKYHIGYIAGVFDLFHIGHLNMFRRAKEQCDYLIVGVVTDEGVREGKKVEPFIPFAERVEVVRACRYVDEVVEIPSGHSDTDMAWRMYHFDVQFSGSDYENDPLWLKKKAFLEERGAKLVFFPYTEQTSSTKIKALINQRLEKR